MSGITEKQLRKNMAMALKGCVRIEAYKTPFSFERPDIPSQQQKSVGTGFFVGTKESSNWFIVLTCAHVIDNTHSSQIAIVFPQLGKARFQNVRIQSICPEYDIGVLAVRIDDPSVRNGIQPLPLHTGIVPTHSSLSCYGYPLAGDALIPTEGQYSGFQNGRLQHACPISPGNSGGPCVENATGCVIGVNSASMVGGGASSIFYASPIAYYRRLANWMVTGNVPVVIPPKLGFCYHKTTDAFLHLVGNGDSRLTGGTSLTGVHLYHLFSNSPLLAAGVNKGALLMGIRWEKQPNVWSEWHAIDRHGDIQVTWNRQKIPIPHLLSLVPLSSSIQVKVHQDGRSFDATVRPRVIQTGAHVLLAPPLGQPAQYCLFGGLSVMQLVLNHSEVESLQQALVRMTPEEREKDTLIVTSVLPGYEDVPLSEGSIIVRANGKEVQTIEAYRKALCSPERGFITIEDKMGKKYVLHVKDALQKEQEFKDNRVYEPDAVVLKTLYKVNNNSV